MNVRDIVSKCLYPVLFALYSAIILYTFAVIAANYPPCRNTANATTTSPCAPPGVEGFYPLGLVFLFFSVLIVHLFYKFSDRPNRDLPTRAIGISITYFVGATIASKDGFWSYSWASGGIVATQAILLGTIFELANRPYPRLQFRSDSELQFYLDNWRQFTRVFLTISIALSIGIFLQTYSSEYLNSRHLVTILGTLAFGMGVALELIRRRIARIGFYLGT